MLVLVISAASQTPSMIGQSEQVLQPGWVSYGPGQTFDPLLALLERCKVASVEKAMSRLEILLIFKIKISCSYTGVREKKKKN